MERERSVRFSQRPHPLRCDLADVPFEAFVQRFFENDPVRMTGIKEIAVSFVFGKRVRLRFVHFLQNRQVPFCPMFRLDGSL